MSPHPPAPSRVHSVRVEGPPTGAPLVLSNALGTTSEVWRPQLDTLARRLRVVRYELQPRRSVAEHADDVVAIAEALGLERFSLCGLSLGAMVGMWLAAEQPSRIDRLVLACTSARFGEPEEWSERAALVRGEGMAEVALAALDKWFTPSFEDREPFLRMQLSVAPGDYALGLEAIGSFDFRDRLAEIGAATLVIAGADDTATTPADAAFIADRIPEARLVVLAGAAHLANVEQPEAFTRAVLEHLSG